MAPQRDPISVRTTRLNSLILGKGNGAVHKPISSGRRSVIGVNFGSSTTSSAVGEAINRESLLDAFCLLYNECDKDVLKKRDRNIAEFVIKYRSVIEETRQLRVNADDFVVKDLIGKGYFGNVHLVVERQTGDVYAMKKIKKSVVTTSQVKEERDIMSRRCSEWITNLQYAFQDNESLYLVMEFLPGGDLLNLMTRHGPFDEDWARFYLGELTLALNSLHKMGYVHRDVKPENILIDRFGHIKLADFGNAAALNRDGQVLSFSPVGTPDYIAPELLQTISAYKMTKSMHDVSCDYWSMGIIGFELICETTPFHEENVHETYNKILTHCEESDLHEIINFPSDMKVSANFKNLIKGLVTNPSNRLCYEQIRRHPYFEGIKWDTLRSQVPPIIPNVNAEDDISNFDDLSRNKSRRNTLAKKSINTSMKTNDFCGKDLPFIGYSFVHMEHKPLNDDPIAEESRAAKLNSKIKELQTKLKERADEIAQLKQELIRAEQMAKLSDCQSKILDDAKTEMTKMKNIIKEKTVELAQYKMQIKTLQSSIKVEEEMWEKKEATITELLRSNRKKYEEAKLATEQRYEKLIAEKKNELVLALQKLDAQQNELRTKNEECLQLREKMEQYKEMLRQFKEQSQKDKEEFEKNKLKLTTDYEEQLVDLRNRLRSENEKKSRLTMELRDAQTELKESNKSTEEVKMVSAKNHEDILKRLNREIEANNELHAQNSELMQRLSEAEKFAHDIQQENNRLEREIQVAECAKNLAETQMAQSPFETAPGSLTELHATEEQLRADLEVAKENEAAEKSRADKLQEMLDKQQEIIDKLKGHSVASPRKSSSSHGKISDAVGTMLERQNEKLEDKLAAVRDQMIIERQAARTANLALWKAEKKAEDLETEKKALQRRMELTEERVKRAQAEKEESQRLQKQAEAEKLQLEERIKELKNEIASLKRDVLVEHRKYERAEEERIKNKSEIIEHIAKVQKVEDTLSDTRLKLRQAQQKCDSLSLENKRLDRELNEERNKSAASDGDKSKLEMRLRNMQENYERLKFACTVTDNQLTEIEAMLEAEQKRNKTQQEKIDSLNASIREKDQKILKLKQELANHEKQKENTESRIKRMKEEIEELSQNNADIQRKLIAQQQQLVEQTNKLFAQEEHSEVLSNEAHNLQTLNLNYERELHLLKEENSRILSELFHTKEHVHRLEIELKDALAQSNEYQEDLEELQQVLREKEEHFMQREIKAEATLAQHKKLIDYLQLKLDDLNQKKKKTLADVLFGSNGQTPHKKETISQSAIESSILYRALQEELKREQLKCKSLQQQIDKLNGNTVGTMVRSPLKSSNRSDNSHQVTSPSKRSSSSAIKSPVKKNLSSEKENTTSKSTKTNTSNTKAVSKSNEMKLSNSKDPVYHRFELAFQETNSGAPMCAACDLPLIGGSACWKCKICKQVTHRKCRSNVSPHCGFGDKTDTEEKELAIEPSAPQKSDLESDSDTISVDRYSYEAKLDEPDSSDNALCAPYYGTHLYSFDSTEIKCAFEMETDKIILLGSATGLFAFHVPQKQLVQIHGIDSALDITISKDLAKTIMVGGAGDALYQCDLRQLQSRCQANVSCVKTTLEASVINLPFANRTSTEKWQLVKISNECENALDSVAIATTSSRIVILKYDIKMQKFKPVRALDTASAVTSITFTRHTAIVASDKFYEIDLSTFGAEEFIDMTDHSLLHTLNCQPVVAITISQHEFLLCYTECGVFVDAYGCRSRPYDISWEYTPTGFIYREPFLYVAHFQSVQVLRLRRSFANEVASNKNEEDKSEVSDFKRVSLSMYMPTLLAESGSLNVYVAALDKNTGQQSIYHLDAMKMFKNSKSGSSETLSSISTSITCGSSVATADTH